MIEVTPAEEADFEHQDCIAEELFDELLQASSAEDCDPVGVAISLFFSLTEFLTEVGWTTKELQKIVAEHSVNNDDGIVH